MLGFPGGPGVKSLPCNVKDRGLIPGQGRSHMSRTTMIPYARGSYAHPPQLLVSCTTTTEARAPQQEKTTQ